MVSRLFSSEIVVTCRLPIKGSYILGELQEKNHCNLNSTAISESGKGARKLSGGRLQACSR